MRKNKQHFGEDKTLCFARLRVFVVLGCVTSWVFSVQFPGWTCAACARKDGWERRVVCGHTRQNVSSLFCEIIILGVIANKTTTRANSSQSNSTHPTQINISSPSFAQLISVLYFQHKMIMFFDNQYFSFSWDPVSRWHTWYMLAW